MITPKTKQTRAHVASHYNDLDTHYRRLWGEHLHHGLWETGKETREQAVVNLVENLAREAGIEKGTAVCDIGCGYGATARHLTDRYGAVVTGYTISERQFEYAKKIREGRPSASPLIRLGDWLENDLPSGGFDVAISIESSEYMEDKLAFFQQAHRVLKPGGRLMIYARLASDDPSRAQIKHLLEPICREGSLTGLGTAADYRTLYGEAGFEDVRFTDFSEKVRRTWTHGIFSLLASFFRDRDARRFLFDRKQEHKKFIISVLRTWLAYQLRCMRFGLFSANKPRD